MVHPRGGTTVASRRGATDGPWRRKRGTQASFCGVTALGLTSGLSIPPDTTCRGAHAPLSKSPPTSRPIRESCDPRAVAPIASFRRQVAACVDELVSRQALQRESVLGRAIVECAPTATDCTDQSCEVGNQGQSKKPMGGPSFAQLLGYHNNGDRGSSAPGDCHEEDRSDEGLENLSSKCPLYEKFDQRIAGGVPCGM